MSQCIISYYKYQINIDFPHCHILVNISIIMKIKCFQKIPMLCLCYCEKIIVVAFEKQNRKPVSTQTAQRLCLKYSLSSKYELNLQHFS